MSICATLGEDPIIRYHRPLDDETGAPVNKSLPYKLAMLAQREIDNYCRVNPNFPVRLREDIFPFDVFTESKTY